MSQPNQPISVSADPLVTARHLTAALQENTTALTGLRRRYRILLVVIILLLFTMGATLKSRYDVRVSSCHQDNELRGGLLHIADTLEDREGGALRLSVVPGFDELDPEMQAYLRTLEAGSSGSERDQDDDDSLIASLREDFALHGCNIPWI